MSMTGCHVDDTTSGNGGFASLYLSELNIMQSVVSKSISKKFGGVIYMSVSTLLTSENVFRNNISPLGGVIYSLLSVFTASHDKFYHNTAWLSGGVVFMEAFVGEDSATDTVIDIDPSFIGNCYFNESTSQKSGAVGKSFSLSNVVNYSKNLASRTKNFLIFSVSLTFGELLIIDSTIENSQSGVYGAIYNTFGALSILRCNFTNNEAGGTIFTSKYEILTQTCFIRYCSSSFHSTRWSNCIEYSSGYI